MSDITPTRPRKWPSWLPLAVIVAGAGAGLALFGEHLSFDSLRANRDTLIAFRDSYYLGTLVTYVAVYVLIVAFSLPGATIATLTGGFLFGLWAGSIATVLAATIGACIIFLAARHGLGDRLSDRLDASEGRIKTLKAGLRDNEWSVLFLMRLVPALPFFVVNLLPAFVGVALHRFAISTFFGIMPATLVYTWLGVGLGEVFARDESPNLGLLFEPHVLGPLLGLAALAAVPLVVKLARRTGGRA